MDANCIVFQELRCQFERGLVPLALGQESLLCRTVSLDQSHASGQMVNLTWAEHRWFTAVMVLSA